MDALDWLAGWYEVQCDGDWEHEYGVTIETVDKPGWSVKIGLAGTDCDGRTFETASQNYNHEIDWWACFTRDNVFHCAGGPRQLRAILETFRDWAERRP